MDIFGFALIGALLFWTIHKVREFFKNIFPDLPEWHDKRGEEYIKWKNNK